MNMGYCRFTNTAEDMRDCLDALRDEEKTSKAEVRAAKRMFTDILDLLIEWDVVDEDGVDLENLEDALDFMVEFPEDDE